MKKIRKIWPSCQILLIYFDGKIKKKNSNFFELELP